MSDISLMEALAKTAGALKNYTDDATGTGGLESVTIGLDEAAPAETVPSICNFTLTPTTMQAAYGLCNTKFMYDNAVFHGREVPLLTTKGGLVIKDADGSVKYSKRIENLINYRGVSDLLTERGVHKAWSEKFYLTKLPVSKALADDFSSTKNITWTWEFTEEDFANTGVPAKLSDIPMASPCFYNASNSQAYINGRVYFAQPYPAKFSYNAETGKYTLIARGVYDSIDYQLTKYSKVYFYYPLEIHRYNTDGFAMGLSAGDTVSFEDDLTEMQEFIDEKVYGTGGNGGAISEYNITPSVEITVPRSIKEAMSGMENAAMMLNLDNANGGGDATVQGYSWIGDGDGVTDYTTKIQNKLNELHSVTNGGDIRLGNGTYPISQSLTVYSNTQIIGTGHTVIEQRSDNTHAIILNGSNIRMSDLTVKLAGTCTEITACVFANSNNTGDNRDEKYPENTYVQFCSASNVTLMGEYGFTYEDGYPSLTEEDLAYRGVGVYDSKLFFNYFDSDRLICKNLYSGIHGGGGANNWRIYVTNSRYAVYGGGGNNIYDISGHTYYAAGRDGIIVGTDYVYHGYRSEYNQITFGFYDPQYSTGIVYFSGQCKSNTYSIYRDNTDIKTSISTQWGHAYRKITDYGRGNAEVQPVREQFVGVGSILHGISGYPVWNTQFNPSVNNALSGAGVWGAITSNKEWTNKGISLVEVCRYPKDIIKKGHYPASVICEQKPSEESPIDIIIDISDRPITNYKGIWIQFDHGYVAEDYTVRADTNNDGEFDLSIANVIDNTEPVSITMEYQHEAVLIYRIKISITKALQIPEFKYISENYTVHTIDYNQEGYIGIVNIGMPSNEAYGRAFLGECGGSLYGNVDMHQNTLKNLPAPIDDGDAVSKAYLEQRLAELEALIGKVVT